MDLQPNRSFTKNDLESMLLDESAEPKALPFSLLENITNSFSYKQEIGRGGFAVVYMGMLENGAVAVKRLSNTYEYENEFLREVECLVKVKHKNIVRFLGYCSDTQGNVAFYNGKFVMADIQERLLCFEFLPKGSLDNYIKDASSGLDWETRFQIIKGICEGLHYLHSINIIHLDLKPSNILMDDNMIPKITDFGLSRSLEEMQTRVLATKMFGTLGYLAPEFTSNVITHKFDLYSLGVIIMEILTGRKERQVIEDVLESWHNRSELSDGKPHSEQIRVCAEIGIECTDFDPTKRPPSMTHIMDMLAETERVEVIPAEYFCELLHVHPQELRFPFKANKVVTCLLHLTNNTDERVAFRLRKKGGCWRDNSTEKLMHGIVPPRSIYTFTVTTEKMQKLPTETEVDLILLSSVVDETEIHLIPHTSVSFRQYDECYFRCCDQLKEQGGALNQVALKAICELQEEKASKITPHVELTSSIWCLDAHPTKPWIIIGDGGGQVHLWNYDTQRIELSFEASVATVHSIKIVARKRWILAGDKAGYIHVYQYREDLYGGTPWYYYGGNPNKIKALKSSCPYYIASLAIHQTKPYMLSASYDCIQLWDWDNDWNCIQTFKEHSSTILHVLFNPMDYDSFVSASKDNTVKVWNLDSPISRYTLPTDSGYVTCLDFFTQDDKQYILTGSSDRTGTIWDMQKGAYMHVMQDLTSPFTCLISPPDFPYVITGSKDGLVHMWSSSDSVHRIFDTTGLLSSYTREVVALQILTETNRIVIGQHGVIAVFDITDYEPAVSQGDNENSISTDSATESNDFDTTKRPVSITHIMEKLAVQERTEVFTKKTKKGMEIVPAKYFCEPLKVHSLDLRLSFKPNKHIACAWSLTNNLDERVAFRRKKEGGRSWLDHFGDFLMVGLVPPRSTYTLVLGKKDMKESATETKIDLILQTIVVDEGFEPYRRYERCKRFDDQFKKQGDALNEVALEVVCDRQEETTSKIITLVDSSSSIWCLDAHPTKPCIIIGDGFGHVHIWNYETQRIDHSFEASTNGVNSTKIVARKQCVLFGDHKGYIHVYHYGAKPEKTKSFKGSTGCPIASLAIHPTKPYVLSATWFIIDLWDWDNDWKRIRTFNAHDGTVTQVAFNPRDQDSFVSASDDNTVKVWNLNSPGPSYTLYGHSRGVMCLDFFTRDDQQYLITGSKDTQAKIWDMQQKTCIHTIENFESPVTCVISLPDRYLVTGSEHGDVSFWRYSDYRLDRIFDIDVKQDHFKTEVRALQYLTESKRIVIGKGEDVSIVDIDAEEAVAS